MMGIIVDTSILFGFEWAEMAAILSLDLVGPFYGNMGLGPNDFARLSPCLRMIVNTNLSAFQEWGASDNLLIEQQMLSKHLLNVISNEIGATYADSFYRWSATVYPSPSTDHPWGSYESAVRVWAALLRHTGESIVQFVDSKSLLHSYLRTRDQSDLDRRVERARNAPLSPWDEFIYGVRKYSNDADLVEQVNAVSDILVLTDPLERVIDIIERNSFQEFWEQSLLSLSPAELDSLHQFAQEANKRGRINPPEELPHPASLHRGIQWPLQES